MPRFDSFIQLRINKTNPPKLVIELVPESCFYSNVRSNITKRDWNRIRMECFRQANNACEICGDKSSRLECHEIWHYDDIHHIQTLENLIALCVNCHRAKHMVLARKMGWDKTAEFHIMRINGWDRSTLEEHLLDAFEKYEERSIHQWGLDITHLSLYSIEVPSKLDRE
jgi:hypothetical protein